MGLTVLDLSAYVGLLAVGAVTLNLLLGMLMAFRYAPLLAPSPIQLLPPPQLVRLHRSLGFSPASRHPAHQQRPSLSPSGPRLPRPLSQPASGKHDWRRRTLPLGLRCRYLVSPSSPRPPPLEILPFQHLFRRRRSVLPQPMDCPGPEE